MVSTSMRLYHGKSLRKSNLVLASATLVGLAATAPCVAEEFDAHTVLQDAKLYFTAPLRWTSKDWLYLGGTLLAIGAAHESDGSVRRHFAVGDHAILNGKDPHGARDALPTAAIVAGTWVYATVIGESSGRVEAYSMLEAAGLSTVSTEFLKLAAGRSRPSETTRVDDWRRAGTSFPSLHASTAFAIGTVFAESGSDDSRWFRRIVGYGTAGITSYARLHDNIHWLSDTVAGAALGIATARFTLNRREDRARRAGLVVVPLTGGGTMLVFKMTLQ
jgi:membrane-associated phospholipid phosphatase